MSNLSLRAKLWGVLTIPIAAIIILALVRFVGTQYLASHFDSMADRDLPVISLLQTLKLAGSQYHSAIVELALQKAWHTVDQNKAAPDGNLQLEAARSDFDQAFGAYRTFVNNYAPEDAGTLTRLELSSAGLLDGVNRIVELQAQGAPGDEIGTAQVQATLAESRYFSDIDTALVAEHDELAESQLAVSSLVNTSARIAIASVFISLILIAGAGLYFLRSIFRPLNNLNAVVSQLREGNLSARSEVVTHDELGQFAAVLNAMAQAVQGREIDLKQARDEALVAQRIAQETTRVKSEFLSTMSHELRTPMNAIEGYTSVMLKHMAGVEFNDKTERYLKKVQTNSQRLLALINDFLDLSRIEAGRLELANLPMCPEETAKQWKESLSVLAESKNLAFELQIDPTLPEIIYCDEESLTKIAINLVGNAIKFTEAGSVTVSLQTCANQMELKVSDTGIGIPAHARDFIFEEFRQVDQSSKRKYGGTGLGLAIAQKLTRAMGGTITLQSKVGVGSVFTVLLPLKTSQLPEKLLA